MRENLTSGSTGGRWKRGNPAGHLRVLGRCAAKRHHDGLVGTQPVDQLLPRQRSTLLRHGVSSRTFSYLDYFTWWRIFGWLRKRHVGLNKGTLVRRFLPGWEVRDGRVEMFRPRAIAIVRYRYRGSKIPTPWASEATGTPAPAA